MFELYPIGTYRSSHDGRMIRANAALLKLNGYDSEAQLLSTFNDLARQWYVDPNRRDEFMKLIEQDGHVLDFVSEIYRRKTGERLWVKENAHVLRDANGKILFYEGTVEDITERRRMEEEVQQQAFYDPLTQLPNRRLFNDRLSQTLARAKRAQSRFALLFIDLDKFKSINDKYGHATGDWLLESVARRIESCLRASDTAARVGGDEFLALLPDILTSEDTLAVADKIRIELDQPFITPSQMSLRSSSSIGIAIYPDHAHTEQELLRLGDRAMYRAKNSGGNDVKMCTLSTKPDDTADINIAGQSIDTLTWKTALNCGQQTLDSEHRELFRLANVLMEKAARRTEKPEQFEAAFDTLLVHVVEHFAHEEAILQSHGYEYFEEHAKMHRELISKVLKLRHPVDLQVGVPISELIDYFAMDVIAGHMMIEDQKFASLFF